MIGTFFRTPPWVQLLVVGLVFASLLTACAQASLAHALWYVGLSLVFLATDARNASFTLQLKSSFNIMAKDRHFVTGSRSRNDIARLSRWKAAHRLTPASRMLLIPPKALLLAFLVMSSLWWFWILLFFLMIHLVAKSVTRRLAVHELTARQFGRDRAARKLLRRVRQGKRIRRPFLVYLRPFAITSNVHTEDPASLALALRGKHPTDFYSMDGQHIGVQIPIFNIFLGFGEQLAEPEMNPELETVMEIGLREVGQLVALGRPGESVGAGRIETSEDDWRRVLTDLGKAAKGFVIVPSTNAGTLWEMLWLRESRSLGDCYFLMPGIHGGEADLDTWLKTRKKLLPVVRLPHHPIAPVMFAADALGRPHAVGLIDSPIVTAGMSVRMFPRAELIAVALKLLSRISSGAISNVIDEFMGIAEQFVEAMFSGADDVLRLKTLTNEFRTQVSSPDFSGIFSPLQSKTVEMIAAADEFFHQEVAGRSVILLRREALVDGERFLFYVSCRDWDSHPGILAFEIIDCEEDAHRRKKLALLAQR